MNEPAGYTANSAREHDVAREHSFNRAMLCWTGIVAVFTVILAIVAAVQCWAFIQSERSSVSVTRFAFVNGLTAGKPLSLLFHVKNSGKSTAQITGASITVRPTLMLPLVYDRITELAPIAVAAGSEEISLYDGTTPSGAAFIVSEALAAAVKSGSQAFFVYGYVDYTDDFPWFGSRRSGFCYVYWPQASTPGNDVFRGCLIGSKPSANS